MSTYASIIDHDRIIVVNGVTIVEDVIEVPVYAETLSTPDRIIISNDMVPIGSRPQINPNLDGPIRIVSPAPVFPEETPISEGWIIENTDEMSFYSYIYYTFSETNPSSILINNDATKMFVYGNDTHKFYEYNLEVPNNINSAVFAASYDFLNYNMTSFVLDDSGTRLFICKNESGNGSIWEFSLLSSWDFSNISYVQRMSIPNGGITDMFFSSNGYRFFVTNTNNELLKYELTYPWEIKTGGLEQTKTFSEVQNSNIGGFVFNPSGLKLYLLQNSPIKIFQYSLSTPWDLDSIIYDNLYGVSREGTDFNDIFIVDENSLIAINTNNNKLLQYKFESIGIIYLRESSDSQSIQLNPLSTTGRLIDEFPLVNSDELTEDSIALKTLAINGELLKIKLSLLESSDSQSIQLNPLSTTGRLIDEFPLVSGSIFNNNYINLNTLDINGELSTYKVYLLESPASGSIQLNSLSTTGRLIYNFPLVSGYILNNNYINLNNLTIDGELLTFLNDKFVTTWLVPADGLITVPTTGTGYDGTVEIELLDGTPISIDTFTDVDMAGLTDIDVSGVGVVGTEFRMRISGTFPRIYFNNSGDKNLLKSVENLGSVGWTSFDKAFYGCTAVTDFSCGDCDTSTVISSNSMFRSMNNSSMVLDLANFNTVSIIDMSYMFSGNPNWPTTPDISGFDLTNCENISYMFSGNYNWPAAPDVSSWDTTNVTNMSNLFYNNYNWKTTPNVSGFDTAKVTDMSGMFNYNYKWKLAPNVSGFDTTMVTDMSNMFSYNANWNVTSFNVSNFDTSNVENMSEMFAVDYNWGIPPDVTGFDTAKVTNMSGMFMNNYYWPASPNVGLFNTSMVTDMNNMFSSNPDWPTIPDVSGFDTGNVTNMSEMFSVNYNWPTTPDVSGFDTSNVKNMKGMFDRNYNWPTTPDVSGFDTSNVTNMADVFRTNYNWPTTPDVSTWDTTKVTNISNMFRDNYNWNTAPDVSGFNTKNIINMSYMFYNCDGIRNININGWNLFSINNMSGFMQLATGLDSSNAGGYNEFLIHLQDEHIAGRLDSGLNIDMGGSMYTTAGTAAHNYMTDTAGWTITDGGFDLGITDFITTWTVPPDGLITVPTFSNGYDGTIVIETLAGTVISTGTFTPSNKAALTNIDVSSIGVAGTEFRMKISGTFSIFYTNNTGDAKLYLKSVENLGSVGWISFKNSFYGCNALTSFKCGDCDTSTVTDMSYMFYGNFAWPTTPNIVGLDTSSVINMEGMFGYNYGWPAAPDVSGFDTSNVTNMAFMFSNNYNWSTTPNVSGFNTAKVTAMYGMFTDNHGWPTAPDVSGFNTSNVTDMQWMFSDNYGWPAAPDVSGFDTSNLETMSYMFENNYNWLVSPDVSGFDTTKVKGMVSVFYNCDGIRSININGWNMNAVTSMYYFMQDATGLSPTGTGGYDEFLIHLQSEHAAGRLNSGLNIDMGESKYTNTTAHNYMTGTAGWTIKDGGLLV